MMNTLYCLLNTFWMLIKILRLGGIRKVAAENIMLRQQLIVMARKQKRSPKLYTSDRFIFGILASIIKSIRLLKVAIIIQPKTILKFQKALVAGKYRLLFSNKQPKKPGPQGPSQEVIDLVLEMKRRNPRFGYRRIAMQLANVFNIIIDKDMVRRILAKQSGGRSGHEGPSWLTFLGHMKDSLWSVDLFRALRHEAISASCLPVRGDHLCYQVNLGA